MKIINDKQRIIDIICNSCGGSCKTQEGIIDNPYRKDHGEKYYGFEHMEIEAIWGYYSGKDDERYTADICEKCVDEKMKFIKFDIEDIAP